MELGNSADALEIDMPNEPSQKRRLRKFTAAKDSERCRQEIVYRDGSGAWCMRKAVKDGLCLQHWKMEQANQQR
jgi:hypothetical protein